MTKLRAYGSIMGMPDGTDMKPTTASRDRKPADQQKTRIHKVCAELFAKHGYGSVGVAELCDAVGLGRGAFYYHVESKENILLEISKGYMESLCQEARQLTQDNFPVEDVIRDLSLNFMQTMFEHRFEMTVCFRELHLLSPENQKIVRQLHSDYEMIWHGVLQRGIENKSFRPLDKIDLKALLGMYFYSFLWARPGGAATAEQIAEHFSRLVLDAIKMPA